MRFILLALTVIGLIHSASYANEDEPNEDLDAQMWARAKAAFAKQVAPLESEIRRRSGDWQARYVEIRSDLLQKYLPDYKVFSQNSNIVYLGTTCTFIVAKDGEIIDLRNTNISGNRRRRGVETISKFMKSLEIKVTNAAEALEIVRLFEELQRAKSYASYLKKSTQDFTVFDRRSFSAQQWPPKHYPYTPSRNGNDWVVTVRYTGPPSSIRMPPTYQIKLDPNGMLSDIYIGRE